MPRKKRATPKTRTFDLDVLDPAAFPDLASVRAFLSGECGAAMFDAVGFSVMPFAEGTKAEATNFPEPFLRAARWAAWHLGQDLATLACVVATEQPTRGRASKVPCDIGRAELLALVLSRTAWANTEREAAVVRHLATEHIVRVEARA